MILFVIILSLFVLLLSFYAAFRRSSQISRWEEQLDLEKEFKKLKEKKKYMIRILKFDVPGTCKGKIRQVLNVKMQYGKPKVWVMMDDTLDEERTLEFFTVGTGWVLKGQDEEIMRQALYVGTVKDEEGYIWHVFCLQVKDEDKKEEDAAEPVSEEEASK